MRWFRVLQIFIKTKLNKLHAFINVGCRPTRSDRPTKQSSRLETPLEQLTWLGFEYPPPNFKKIGSCINLLLNIRGDSICIEGRISGELKPGAKLLVESFYCDTNWKNNTKKHNTRLQGYSNLTEIVFFSPVVTFITKDGVRGGVTWPQSFQI